jgi:ribulose-phosphate 3-epimerase
MASMSWDAWIRDFEVEPSLYAADFLRLGEQIESLLEAGARVFHVDVGDGHFIPPITIGPVVVRSIAPLIHAAGGLVDSHLMVESPLPLFSQIKEAGGDGVTFHLETVDDPRAAIAVAREHDLAVGVACNPGTPVEQLASAVSHGADLALVMSVHPGYSGQAFIPESVERVRRLRELLGPDALIQVDGGVGAGNVHAVHEAGADLIVAGSSIFNQDDIAGAYRALVDALD